MISIFLPEIVKIADATRKNRNRCILRNLTEWTNIVLNNDYCYQNFLNSELGIPTQYPPLVATCVVLIVIVKYHNVYSLVEE